MECLEAELLEPRDSRRYNCYVSQTVGSPLGKTQMDHHLDQCKIMYNNEYIMNNDELSCKFKVVLFGCNVFTELAKVMLK